MKLDVTCMRYLSKDDYRVLQAVEMGMRNHELVPVHLITNIARLRHGGSYKILSTLLRYKLVAHANNQYDGYRLSYMGFDILALRTLLVRGVITNVGSQIGVGKESDIFEALDANGEEIVLKIHRLGRTSFRAVRKHRDYMAGKHKASWLYMSRLAAIKEYAFMRALYDHGFPTPIPIEQNRHIVAMSRIRGFPMAQVKSGNMQGANLYFETCMSILKRLAEHGLVHCDFNEFNIMIGDEGTVTLIDFPQMVATTHPNAVELFNRDVNGLMKFFRMKMRYDAPDSAIPQLSDIVQSDASIVQEVLAKGAFTEAEDRDLQQFMAEQPTEELDGESDEGDEDVEEGEEGDLDVEGLDAGDGLEHETPVDSSVERSQIPETIFRDVTAGNTTESIATGATEIEYIGEDDRLSIEDASSDASGDEEDDEETAVGDATEVVHRKPHGGNRRKGAVGDRVKMELKSRQSRWGDTNGSRNATKKRTKFGKIDKSAGRVDHGW